MSKEVQHTEERVIEAMMQENVEEYKRKPAKAYKSLLFVLLVGLIIVTTIFLMTGAYYVLSFFIEGNWR